MSNIGRRLTIGRADARRCRTGETKLMHLSIAIYLAIDRLAMQNADDVHLVPLMQYGFWGRDRHQVCHIPLAQSPYRFTAPLLSGLICLRPGLPGGGSAGPDPRLNPPSAGAPLGTGLPKRGALDGALKPNIGGVACGVVVPNVNDG